MDRWYIENETVRTRVTLAIGAVTPTVGRVGMSAGSAGLGAENSRGAVCFSADKRRYVEWDGCVNVHTPKETPELLRAICVAHTIQKPRVFIRLHARLHAIEGEGGGSGQHARHGGRNLGAILLDEALLRLPRSVSLVFIIVTSAVRRHGGRR